MKLALFFISFCAFYSSSAFAQVHMAMICGDPQAPSLQTIQKQIIHYVPLYQLPEIPTTLKDADENTLLQFFQKSISNEKPNQMKAIHDAIVTTLTQIQKLPGTAFTIQQDKFISQAPEYKSAINACYPTPLSAGGPDSPVPGKLVVYKDVLDTFTKPERAQAILDLALSVLDTKNDRLYLADAGIDQQVVLLKLYKSINPVVLQYDRSAALDEAQKQTLISESQVKINLDEWMK